MTSLDSNKQRVLESRYHEKALQEIVKRNKRCADCSKPAPSFVNLSIGSFVCLECSGLLREFEMRTKGLSLSTFTPQEVQMLDLKGGNKRVNEIYLGKHPDRDRASPGYENLDELRKFLVRKYRNLEWYDQAAAQKPTEPVRSRADSTASADSNTGLSPSIPQGRKRVGSKEVVRGATITGQESHRSFLAATHARAAAQQNNNSAPGSEEEDLDEEDGDTDDSLEEITDPVLREKKQREKIRKVIREFYAIHNPEKVDSIEIFVEWVMYHGMGAFNKKLREKYGTDVQYEKRKDLKTKKLQQKAKETKVKAKSHQPPAIHFREEKLIDTDILDQATKLAALEQAAQALALEDLASRRRASSNNPFDDIPSAPPVQIKTQNPFDELMFL